MLNEFRNFADWLVFGPEVEDDGFIEARVSGNNTGSSPIQHQHVRRALSKEEKENEKGIHESGGGLIDLQCGKRVFNDAPAKMRTELWLSQLHRQFPATEAGCAYVRNLNKSIDEEVLSEIEKDIHRTFPGHRTLSSKTGQRAMANVLRAYASFDPEVGYSQGMNFLSGILLTYLSPPQAFDALVLVMQERGLREYYKPNGMVHLQARLWQLSKLIPTEMERHLENHMVLPVLYASSWLLTCFASEFPIKFAARVMDVIITDSYYLPIMKVSIKILERCKDDILKMDSMEDIVELIRKRVPKWSEDILQDLLTASLGTSWSEDQLELLGKSNSMAETVVDAVRRIQGSEIIEKEEPHAETKCQNSNSESGNTNCECVVPFDSKVLTRQTHAKREITEGELNSVEKHKTNESPFESSNFIQTHPEQDEDDVPIDQFLSHELGLTQEKQNDSLISYEDSMRSLLHNFSLDGPDASSIAKLRDVVFSHSVNYSQGSGLIYSLEGEAMQYPQSHPELFEQVFAKENSQNIDSEFGDWQSS